ncbi:hypothetical protein IWQ56_006775, partial [Coemansia nantahalensis]
ARAIKTRRTRAARPAEHASLRAALALRRAARPGRQRPLHRRHPRVPGCRPRAGPPAAARQRQRQRQLHRRVALPLLSPPRQQRRQRRRRRRPRLGQLDSQHRHHCVVVCWHDRARRLRAGPPLDRQHPGRHAADEPGLCRGHHWRRAARARRAPERQLHRPAHAWRRHRPQAPRRVPHPGLGPRRPVVGDPPLQRVPGPVRRPQAPLPK